MKRHRSSRWLMACSVAACASVASAGPEECLTLRDNAAVATCANKYAPGTFPIDASSSRNKGRIEHRPILAAERWLLFPIPSATAQPGTRARVIPEVAGEEDRSELIRRSEIGAAGLAAMGLLFGLWRWRAASVRRCSFCGTRAVAGSSVCKRCFRSV